MKKIQAADSPYSEEELKQALDSLLLAGADGAVVDAQHDGAPSRVDLANAQEKSLLEADSRHLYGYQHGRMLEGHRLSMLQTITATRILDYENRAEDLPVAPSFDEGKDYKNDPRLNLQSVIKRESPRMALAAEFKRASPSKGAIALHLKCGDQAAKYAEAGANIISVLTEHRWFQGSLADLSQARAESEKVAHKLGLKSRPAILRKDFVVNQKMIDEAASAGADTVLLIVAVLPFQLLKQLITYCRSQYQMEPLVEVHADVELEVALEAGAKVIGVNNRNLHTFQMDLGTSNRVAERLLYRGLEFHHNNPDAEYTLCALSGMSTAFNVDRYRQVGLGMCLIGESLMRAADPKTAIANLCLHPNEFTEFLASSSSSNSSSPTSTGGGGGAYTGGTQIIKVCGITNAADAVVACRSGANLIGVIFAERSKRKVSPEQAKEVVQVVRAFGERSNRVNWNTNDSIKAPLLHMISSSTSLIEGSRRPAVVGVFQNQEPEYIRQMVEECGLDLVQLHGSEGMVAANRKNFGAPAIRVVNIATDPITGEASESAVDNILASITNDPIAILLDTSIKGQKEGGGTGVSFDWSIAARVQSAGLPVIVAGGLTPETVKECVQSTRPFGVDVSSGVETEPGRKDHDKVRSFVQGAIDEAEHSRKGF